jgi:hypothetical protein
MAFSFVKIKVTARLCAEGKQKVLSTFSKVVQSRVKLWSLVATSEILYRQAHF